MQTRAISNEAEYREVLKGIGTLMRASADLEEGERLDALVRQVEAWERERYTFAS